MAVNRFLTIAILLLTVSTSFGQTGPNGGITGPNGGVTGPSGSSSNISGGGATYYMTPTGNDANSGTITLPWASPNHAINCGDVISAAAGTYSSANFGARGNWGTVSNCPSTNGIYFASVKCAGPYVTSCIINDTTGAAVVIDQSNWAFIGWTVSSSYTSLGGCLIATPSTTATIHHIAFINVVANGCFGGGIGTTSYYANSAYSVDQFAVVGAIAYNAAQGASECYSGVGDFQPTNFDTSPGTHVFIAGVFSYGNIDPATCNSSANSDGEGIIFDTWSGNSYTGQGVIEQSMFLGNGNPGILVFNNTTAPIYIRSSTSWGNFRSTTQVGGAGELTYNGSTAVTSAIGNLLQGTVVARTGVYGCLVNAGGANDVVSGNYCVGPSGQNTSIVSSPGFSFGANITTSPGFASPAIPSVPSCSGVATTTLCMASVIANFANTTGLGYQPPGPCTPDPLFPTWLAGMVPDGIITKPCGL